MTTDAHCPLCAEHLTLPARDVLLHLDDDGSSRWAVTCTSCGVLAVVPGDPCDVGDLLRDATLTSGPTAPWDADDLGHDAVCVASSRVPEHDVDAPPLSELEVAALVDRLDDLLDASA